MNVRGARLEHVGVAVKSIDAAAAFWRDALGLAAAGEEIIKDKNLRLLFLEAGDGVRVELLEGSGGDVISDFVAKRGEGIHHLCFRVDDLREAVAALKSQGYEFVTEEPYSGADGGRVIFMKPRSAFGVLIELTGKG